MRKWTKMRIFFDDGSTVEWTPEDLEKIKGMAKSVVDMLLRSAKKDGDSS